MDPLDDIIARFAGKVPKEPMPRELYHCEQEDYDVTYEPDSETAFFCFSEGEIKRRITLAERDHFVKTGYWTSSEAL